MPHTHHHTDRDPRAEKLTLDEKCRLLGGASIWRTHPVESQGIPALKMSDGPNGVRGDGLGAVRTPGVVIPTGIVVGASWDPALAAELGDLLGKEARRKGAHVLLAPTVNLQRTPVGGRVFECLSEDPELSAALAVAIVRGVQRHDVAVTVKHFVVNDTEVDRMTVDVDIDEAPLRELYLRPFEAAVTEAGAWGIMSAYNQLHGEHCAHNRRLLTEILRDEWGFDGFVVSDWFGSHDTVASAEAGLDVPMPGPHTIYGDRLAAAVRAGDVEEEAVDALVDDVLTLIARTRADERDSEVEEETVDDPDERALCRRAAIAGLVLAKNDQAALPLDPVSTRLAVVGPNAAETRIMGGGSSSLHPISTSSVLDGLRARFGDVDHEVGVRIDRLPPPLTGRNARTPDGEPGLLLEYRNGGPDGPIAVTQVSPTSQLRFFGSTPPEVDAERFHVTVRGSFVPEVTGPHTFSAVMTGKGQVSVGDTVVLDDPDRSLPRGPLFMGTACVEQIATIDCTAGEAVPVHIATGGVRGYAGVQLGVRPPHDENALARAASLAGGADAAVVVVGTNDDWETEGEDRTTIQLPGEQDDLVRQVAAAQPRTVVVVNSGGPVAMPWVDDVAAVLIAPFGGQELGNAVADVLAGVADPGGRLPITHPRTLDQTPAWPWYQPEDGIQRYGEGLLMGYRGFLAAGTEPLFPFGHGLSYGQADWGEVTVPSDDVDPSFGVTLTVPVTATGDRAATVVVQGYVAELDPAEGQPPKRLAGFAKAVVDPGQRRDVEVRFPAVAFRRWDTEMGTWRLLEGPVDLVVGSSATREHQRVRIDLVHV